MDAHNENLPNSKNNFILNGDNKNPLKPNRVNLSSNIGNSTLKNFKHKLEINYINQTEFTSPKHLMSTKSTREKEICDNNYKNLTNSKNNNYQNINNKVKSNYNILETLPLQHEHENFQNYIIENSDNFNNSISSSGKSIF